MKIMRFTFNMVSVNTYVIWDEQSLKCAIVDAGCFYPAECEELDLFIARQHLTVKYQLATHLHFDHTFGSAHVAGNYRVPYFANCADMPLWEQTAQQAAMFGIRNCPAPATVTDNIIDGTELRIGNEILRAIAVPGHSPGSIAYYAPESAFVLTGDALFQGSIGRTDLPGGDFDTLIKSIRDRLLLLPDDTVVYPGHGPESTILTEKRYNPFIRA